MLWSSGWGLHLLPRLMIHLEPRVTGFDHAALILQLKVDTAILGHSAFPYKKRKREVVILPDETELDKLVICTLAAGKDESKNTLSLFGPVFFTTEPVKVTLSGVCKNSRKHTAYAGAAAYLSRANSNLNRSARVWGTPTNAHADLVALLLALQAAPRKKSSLSLQDLSMLSGRSNTMHTAMMRAAGNVQMIKSQQIFLIMRETLNRMRLCSVLHIPQAMEEENNYSLKDVFVKRLNPPTSLPDSFDTTQHKINRMLADSIPDSTTDSTAEKFFSAEWMEGHMAWVKNHIRKHGMDSATGKDVHP
ncbi:hypothetical protein B0H10DRAFT_1939668 [Mycena sp. CBHHK59/15]|nr:hypothetical protein B0H10DRAFT_1939668 [Mycena sp. CBHHK59/15]